MMASFETSLKIFPIVMVQLIRYDVAVLFPKILVGIIYLLFTNINRLHFEQDIPTSGLAEMFNCQFFLAAQCNPHIAPFFFNTKGDVGRPNRWIRGTTEHSWRGGFLLAALEIYLKYSMRAKFHFLNDLEAAIGFTSTMMTQTYGGSTTIVPRISFQDYFKVCIFSYHYYLS